MHLRVIKLLTERFGLKNSGWKQICRGHLQGRIDQGSSHDQLLQLERCWCPMQKNVFLRGEGTSGESINIEGTEDGTTQGHDRRNKATRDQSNVQSGAGGSNRRERRGQIKNKYKPVNIVNIVSSINMDSTTGRNESVNKLRANNNKGRMRVYVKIEMKFAR